MRGAFPAIVDEATWDACQQVALRNRRVPTATGRRGPSPYLLSGVLRCRRCGSTMSGERRLPDRTHHEPRFTYSCYLRRVAGECDAPYARQDRLETELLEVLRAVALPAGLADAVDADVAAGLSATHGESLTATFRKLDARLDRLRDMYELGDIQRDEYLARRSELAAQRAKLSERPPLPLVATQGERLRTVLDEWKDMSPDERRLLVGSVFEEIRAEADVIVDLLPREVWKPYMRAVLPKKGGPERKTGLQPASYNRLAGLKLEGSTLRRAA